MIQERLRQGVYVKDIAAELGVHPRTASRARRRGDAPLRQHPPARPSKLDRYKPEIDRWLLRLPQRSVGRSVCLERLLKRRN
jgi:transposase-like protein